MHSAALLSAILLAAVKADLQLDSEDISTNCTSICRPVLELSRTCDVDDDAIPDDLTEDRLQLQCLCTNNSFDVQRFAGLCQSCMQQNTVVDTDDDNDADDRPDDNNRDINEIVSRCGFSGATYSASDADAANGVVVSASRPNNANQLTTTITGGAVAAPTGGSGATSAGTFTSTVTSGSSTIVTTGTTTATGGAAATGTGATVAGAPGLEPLGGGMKVFLTVVGAGVLGFWMH